MPKELKTIYSPKYAKTAHEVTQGELLVFADLGSKFFDFERMDKLPKNPYKLEIPGSIYLTRKWGDSNREPKIVERAVGVAIGSISSLPTIKNYHIGDIALKWVLPELYYKESDRHEGSYRVYDYQQSAKVCAIAIDLYKKIVNEEFLPLFVPEDRELVKCQILSSVFHRCFYIMVLALHGKLESDIKRNIKEFGLTGIPQEMIDVWIELASICDAVATEGNYYIKTLQWHKYKTYQAKLKNGEVDGRYPKHPNSKDFAKDDLLSSPSCIVKDFLKERDLALNPRTTIGEKISVKAHPVIMLFSQQLQKATNFVSESCISEQSCSGEQAFLLDKLEGYEPAYIAPRAMKSSSLDNELKLTEKNIVQQAEGFDANNPNELLEIIASGLKLMSLVHMRYRASLNDKNDYAYLGLSKTNSAIDKDTYYKIFAFYMEHIFNKTLTSLAILVNKSSDIGDNIATQVANALQDLENYCQDIKNQENVDVLRAFKMLNDLHTKLGNYGITPRHDIIYGHSELRHRTGRKVSPNIW